MFEQEFLYERILPPTWRIKILCFWSRNTGGNQEKDGIIEIGSFK